MEYLLSNEVVMNPEFREKVLAAKGFCNRHTHLLYRTTRRGHTEDGLGYALYMQGVVKRIIEQLELIPPYRLSTPEGSASVNILVHRKSRRKAFSLLCKAVEQAVKGQQHCPACESLWSSDQIHLHTLVQMLDNEDFRQEFKSSKGVCLPHFVSAIQMVRKSKLKNPVHVARALVEVEIKRLQLLEHLLSEFARKQSWDFRNEPAEAEVNANPLVLNLLVGAEGLDCQSYKAISPRE